MTLPVPYPVFGVISDGGSPVSGANVYIQDTTVNGTVLSMLTDTQGRYQFNISSNATDGDTIMAWAYYNGKYCDESFTLNIGSKAHRINLSVDYIRLTEKMTITDAVLQDASLIKQDNLSMVDTHKKTVDCKVSDMITITDSNLKDVSATVQDTMNITDSHTKSVDCKLDDTMNITDANTKDVSIIKSDTMGISDAMVKQITMVLGDQLSILDSIVKDTSLHLDDTVIIADSYIEVLFESLCPYLVYGKNEEPYNVSKRGGS